MIAMREAGAEESVVGESNDQRRSAQSSSLRCVANDDVAKITPQRSSLVGVKIETAKTLISHQPQGLWT